MLHFEKEKKKKKKERKEKESKERRKTKAIDLDNNNSAPSFLRSLCEIGGDCFNRGVFLRERSLGRKRPRSKTITKEFTKMTETKMV